MRVQFKGTELVEADVNMVAMVKHGASRLPFKIVKSEDAEMLDLSKVKSALFKTAAPAAPAVAAVMVAKSADLGALSAVLKAAGVDVATGFAKSEDDQAVTFSVADLLKAEGTKLVQFSDDVYMAITGVMKGFEGYDFESTSFKEIMSKGAFIPSICVAQDMFSRTMYNVLEKAATPKEAASQIAAVTKDFSEYVTMLAKSLPESAFKADIAITKAAGEKKTPAKEEPKAEAKKDNGDGSAFEAGRVTQGGVKESTPDKEQSVADQSKTPNPTVPGLMRKENETDAEYGLRLVKHVEEHAKLEAKKAETAPITDGMAALTKLFTEGMNTLTKHVDTSVAAVREEVKTVKSEVTKSLESVVIGGEHPGDKEQTTKSDKGGDGAPPLLDTGFMKLDVSKAKPLANGRMH